MESMGRKVSVKHAFSIEREREREREKERERERKRNGQHLLETTGTGNRLPLDYSKKWQEMARR